MPLIKAAIEHKGAAFIDVIRPCVAFNNHAGSTKSFDYVREHNEAVNRLDFITGREPIRSITSPARVELVEQHDGSTLALRKLDADYDVHDRLAAMNFLQQHAAKGQIVTGLLYVRPRRKTCTAISTRWTRRSTRSARKISARALRRSTRSTPACGSIGANRSSLVPAKAGTQFIARSNTGFPLARESSGSESLFRRLDDRVVARGVEAEQIPGLLHVRRQRRRDVDHAAARMRHRDAARQQMQLVLHAAGQFPVLESEVFRVADDRMADMRHVGAQLVGAAGHRLEREPGELLAPRFRPPRNRSPRGSRPPRRAGRCA